jgi:hypothetical protein
MALHAPDTILLLIYDDGPYRCVGGMPGHPFAR